MLINYSRVPLPINHRGWITMNAFEKNIRPQKKGQGALEYLLLIGGAVLVATIVLIVILGSTSGTNTIINNNIGQYQSHISLNAAGGGGGGAVCGNSLIEGSEQCDGANLSGETCVTQGFASGTLSCAANCTFNTTSCNPSGPPAFASFSAASTTGSGLVAVTWNVSSGFNSSFTNVIHGWTSDPGITTVAQFNAAVGSAVSTNNISASTGSVNASGLAVNQPHFFYMMACNGPAATDCTVSSMSSATSSYDAYLFEAESYDAGSNTGITTLGGAVYSNAQYAARQASTCTGATGTATFTFAVDPLVTSPTNYTVWMRTFKSAGATDAISLSTATWNINPVALGWQQATAGITLSAGTPTLTLTIPCTSATTMDKFLLTTDAACVPFNDTVTPLNSGVNCQ